MCDAFVIIWKRGATETQEKNNNHFFPFPVFSIVICLLHPFFYFIYSTRVLFSEKKSHKWIDAVKSRILFCSVFKLYFIVFLLSFFFSLVLIWFSRVCLNHSLLTYKVCLNKHVLVGCIFFIFSPLVLAFVRLHVFCHSLHWIYCIFAPELMETFLANRTE